MSEPKWTAEVTDDSDVCCACAVVRGPDEAIAVLRGEEGGPMMQLTPNDMDRLLPLLASAMAEVDAAVDPDAAVQPDDGLALMDAYDWAKNLTQRIVAAQQEGR